MECNPKEVSFVVKEIISLDSDEEEIKEAKTSKQLSGQKRKKEFSRRNSYFLRIGKNTVIPMILLLQDPSNFDDIQLQELLSVLREILPIEIGILDIDYAAATSFSHISMKQLDTAVPRIYDTKSLKFSFQFRPTVRNYCLIVKKHTQQSSTIGKDSVEAPKVSAQASVTSSTVESIESTVETSEAKSAKEPSPTEVKESKSEHENEVDESLQPYQGGGFSGFNIFRFTLIIETLTSAKEGEDTQWTTKKAQSISHYFGTQLPSAYINIYSVPEAKKLKKTSEKVAIKPSSNNKGTKNTKNKKKPTPKKK